MFFRDDCKLIKILRIYSFSQTDIIRENFLDFSSLSIRYDSEAKFEANGKTYDLHSGAVAFVPSGLAFKRKSKKDSVIVINFEIDRDYKDIEVFYPQNVNAYYEQFNKALDIWNKNLTGGNAECMSVMYHILSMIYNDIYIENKMPEIIVRALSRIHADFSDSSLTVSSIAKENYVCEVYLRRLFHKYLNTSPKQYITDLRMKNAMSLLKTGDFSITEIACRCGYSGISYFSSAFKVYFGKSPESFK